MKLIHDNNYVSTIIFFISNIGIKAMKSFEKLLKSEKPKKKYI